VLITLLCLDSMDHHTRLVLAHPVPSFIGMLVNDMALKILAHVGITPEAFDSPDYEPHAPVALAALRLLSRETYAFLVRHFPNLPRLSALVSRVLATTNSHNIAVVVEPRPWYRVFNVAEAVMGTRQALTIFGKGAYWSSLSEPTVTLLMGAAIRGRNLCGLTHALTYRHRVHDQYFHEHLLAVIQGDWSEAFLLILGPRPTLTVRDPNNTWITFFKARMPQLVLTYGALSCFKALLGKARAKGEAHQFLLGAHHTLRVLNDKATKSGVTILNHRENRRALETFVAEELERSRLERRREAEKAKRAAARAAALEAARAAARAAGEPEPTTLPKPVRARRPRAPNPNPNPNPNLSRKRPREVKQEGEESDPEEAAPAPKQPRLDSEAEEENLEHSADLMQV
jgi:hypothetical protein